MARVMLNYNLDGDALEIMILAIFQSSGFEAGMLRDYIFVLRAFTSFVCFYLAYQIGRRISEAGLVSLTTGMTLYLIGNGLFQWAETNQAFYATWENTLPLFQSIGVFYFLMMALYPVLTESEEMRNFPVNPNGCDKISGL